MLPQDIHVSSLRVMKIESQKVWSVTTLLAAIGGFSGLLLGFSLFSFLEWVEFLCLLPFFGVVSAARTCDNKRAARKQTLNSNNSNNRDNSNGNNDIEIVRSPINDDDDDDDDDGERGSPTPWADTESGDQMTDRDTLQQGPIKSVTNVGFGTSWVLQV
jgi:hypothetical protein